MGALLNQISGNEENQHLMAAIERQMDALRKAIGSLHRALSEQPYPLDHAKGEITIAASAAPRPRRPSRRPSRRASSPSGWRAARASRSR